MAENLLGQKIEISLNCLSLMRFFVFRVFSTKYELFTTKHELAIDFLVFCIIFYL